MARQRWSFIIGSLCALGVALYGSYASFGADDIAGSAGAAADWFAAGIVYFFIGALLGVLIDAWRARKQWTVRSIPEWAWLTAGLWAFGTIGGYLTTRSPHDHALLLLYPLAYGIFFVGVALAMAFPSLVTTSWGKPVLELLFLGVFCGWLVLEWRDEERTRWLRRALLFAIFLVLIAGVAECLRQAP